MRTVAEVMTQEPRTITADASVVDAAHVLAQMGVGALPVEKDDRLIGILTDRDIVLRVIADHRDPNGTRVAEVVSDGVKYCYDDEDVEHVAKNMDKLLVRRLPVVNRDKRLIGIVSIDDIRPRH